MTNFIILTLLGSSRDLFLYIGVAGVMLIETIFLNDPVMQHTLLSCATSAVNVRVKSFYHCMDFLSTIKSLDTTLRIHTYHMTFKFG
jgi:hypothetical protein